MRARAELAVEADGRLGRVVSAPPITFRAAGDAVYVVGTAAGPLGDDDLQLVVRVADGASLTLRSAASSIVYAGTASAQEIEVHVGAAARLDWHLEPLVVTGCAHHRQRTRLYVAAGGSVDWTDEVVLGRHGEGPGRFASRFDVDVGGRPLLRHGLDVGAPGWDGPAVLGAARVAGLRLLVGPGFAAPTELCGQGWAWLALDGPGWLLSAVAADLPELRRRMHHGNGPLDDRDDRG